MVRRRVVEETWNRFSGVPLLVLSLVFLVFYAIPIINPEIDSASAMVCEIGQNVIWALFILDYIFRLVISRDKKLFFRSNIIELIAVALPFLRPLRALRLLSIVTIGMRRFASTLRNRFAIYVIGAAVMLWFITGLAVTEAERGHPGANIQNVWQGWWWSFITLATVGYGDKFPVSPEGQWVGVIIVLTGIALLGTVSAVLASWFVDGLKVAEKELIEDSLETKSALNKLVEEVQAIRAENRDLKTEILKIQKND